MRWPEAITAKVPHATPPGGIRVLQAEQNLAKVQAVVAERERVLAESNATTTRVEPVANVSDPDSRIMKTPKGWLQGYNAQAAVNEKGIVVAAKVTNDANDVGQCEPMMTAIAANLATAGIDYRPTLLFDAGYLSTANLTAHGPDRLIATTKSWKIDKTASAHAKPSHESAPIQAMEHRLRTPEGKELYKKRQHTIEPLFGNIKENRSIRRFIVRTLDKVNTEWLLICTTQNILKYAAALR